MSNERVEQLKQLSREKLGPLGGLGIDAEAINEQLASSETPTDVIKVRAEDESTAGWLVLTEQRLVFVRKGLFKSRNESLQLSSVSTITVSGVMTKKIQLALGSRQMTYKAEGGAANHAKDFVDSVRSAMAHAHAPKPVAAAGAEATPHSTASSKDDQIAKLERLGALRAQGLLTEEEFAAAKRQLLGLGA